VQWFRGGLVFKAHRLLYKYQIEARLGVVEDRLEALADERDELLLHRPDLVPRRARI